MIILVVTVTVRGPHRNDTCIIPKPILPAGTRIAGDAAPSDKSGAIPRVPRVASIYGGTFDLPSNSHMNLGFGQWGTYEKTPRTQTGAPCFDRLIRRKRPCFGGLTFKNRGHLGSRQLYKIECYGI